MRACRAALASARRLVSSQGATVALLEPALGGGGGGAYRLALSAAAYARPRPVVFVDVAPPPLALVPGRPFGMVQGGEGGARVEALLSPCTGDLRAVHTPPRALPQALAESGGRAWLAEVDPMLEPGERDADLDALEVEGEGEGGG